MTETTEQKLPGTEEELVKSEKIDQPSEDTLIRPKPSKDEVVPQESEKGDEIKPSAHEDDVEKELKEEKSPEGEELKDKDTPVKNLSDSVPCVKPLKEKIVRNQSDIFSLKDVTTTLQTSIFSVNGSPSRKVFRKQEPASHVFQKNEDSSDGNTVGSPRITRENYNDEKRPSSSYRNPLTGTGLSSNDEYKCKGLKRKDGNPLLGLGYDPEEISSSASQHRVPPGGFSHKLW